MTYQIALSTPRFSQARMYADDTNLTFASNDIDDINYHLNHDLANVNKWLIANRLTLNQSKTEFMLIVHDKE